LIVPGKGFERSGRTCPGDAREFQEHPVFVVFLPFIAFRETARALGEAKLHELFLNKGPG
jgi:hypothetical protein